MDTLDQHPQLLERQLVSFCGQEFLLRQRTRAVLGNQGQAGGGLGEFFRYVVLYPIVQHFSLAFKSQANLTSRVISRQKAPTRALTVRSLSSTEPSESTANRITDNSIMKN